MQKFEWVWFAGVYSIDEAKKIYRALALRYHPDRGGDNDTMQAINAEFDSFVRYGYTETPKDAKEAFRDVEIDPKFYDCLIQIIDLHGLNIELVGCWIWVTGNTYTHKETLKASGCFFAPKKQCWYFRPAEYASKNTKNTSLQDIRNKYGSTSITNKNIKKCLHSPL
jgi:hypothetical protein